MARNGRSKGSRRRPHTRTSAAQGVQPTIAPCARSARPCNRMDGPARVIAAPTACLAPPWQHATGQTQHPRASRAHRCGTDCRQAGRAGGRGAALGDVTPWQARLEKRLKDEERANKLATREQVRPGLAVAATRECCSHGALNVLSHVWSSPHLLAWLFACVLVRFVRSFARYFGWFARLPPSFAALLSSPAVCLRRSLAARWLACVLVCFLAHLGGWLFVCVCAQSRVCLVSACSA